MKKFLVLMAALALVFAFVACGDDDDPAPVSSSSKASSSVASTSSTASTGSSNSTASSTSSVASTTSSVASYSAASAATTTTNYDFDGNIDDLWAEIKAACPADSSSISTFTTTSFTGIVVFKKVALSTNDNKYYISEIVVQDMNAAIPIYPPQNTMLADDFVVGSKYQFSPKKAKNYHGLLEVTELNSYSVSAISSGHQIYVVSATPTMDLYNSNGTRVYSFTTGIATAPTQYGYGTLSTTVYYRVNKYDAAQMADFTVGKDINGYAPLYVETKYDPKTFFLNFEANAPKTYSWL
ncbi:MAG TPA: hypothetical protein PK297_12305 [Spirochaetota bacterium]|nr:hypothetical protein [Spirochaetota bacterium]